MQSKDIRLLREYIVTAVLERLSQNNTPRHEALCDTLALGMPNLDQRAVEGIAAMVPQLPESLYSKWAHLFADRLFETVSHEQIIALCDGSLENKATLLLVYCMFMESERMEKIVEKDLRAHAASEVDSNEMTRLLGIWLQHKMTGAVMS